MNDIDRTPQVITFPSFQWTPNRYTASAVLVGDAVDRAWAELGVWMKAVIIPPEYAAGLDIGDSHAMVDSRSNPDAPYAGYPADLQVFHKLHCLNLIRQALYYNVDHYRGRTDVPMWAPDQKDVVETHIAHCVDDLRVSILCEADIRVVPYYNDPKGAMPDFARSKKCRNFESVKDWATKHQWDGAVHYNETHI
ncbi:hypothetical protein CBER1_11755 [Cercospora berteroae]|uniref:Tat pathway signal sequence n=1 Tax=Cercospora berteroae TaxID=357750 RepID=A0A2S6CLJ0_9PEZI|nr:hypothetical protein CBER1_11755 [Cercospora berteroae]